MIKLCAVLGLMMCTAAIAQQSLTDPTRPYTSKATGVMENQDSNLGADKQATVSAIFVSEDSKHAIINGENYSLGQRVLGNEIIAIEQYRVVISTVDGLIELFINNNNVKKDVSHGF